MNLTPQTPSLRFGDQTDRIIQLAIEVHRHLGAGFLEIVYKDALSVEFSRAGVYFEREKEYMIYYKGILLPHRFFADFVVMDNVILEVKAKTGIPEEDMAQTINYLKCSGCPVGLILNFGQLKLGIRRVVY